MKNNRLIVGTVVAGLFFFPVANPVKSSTDIGSVYAEEKLSASSPPAKLKAKLAEIDNALQSTPSAKAYAAKANVLVFMEDFSNALENINKAIKMSPLSGKYYAYRGLIYSAQGNSNETIKNIEKAKSLNFSDPDYLGILALAQTDKKEFGKALKNAEAAIREDRNNLAALHARARVQISKKNYSAAIQDFTLALRSNANLPEIYKERASAWEMIGNRTKAESDRSMAKKLKAGN